MGPVMVKCAAEGGGSYSTKDWHTLVNHQGEVPFLSAHATRSEDGRGLQIMAIQRRESEEMRVSIALAGFDPRPEVEVLTINGPSLLGHNDVADREPRYHSFADAPDPVVKLERTTWTGAASNFAYT